MNFAFTALDGAGEEKTDTIEAPTQQEAIRKIRDRGLFPTKIKQIKNSAGERKTPLDEEMDKIDDEIEIDLKDDEKPIPEPDSPNDDTYKDQVNPDEPKQDINVLLQELMKLYKEYEPLINKMAGDFGISAAQKVMAYKSKPTQMVAEQQATNRKLDVQNVLLTNISDTLIEILKQQHEIKRKT